MNIAPTHTAHRTGSWATTIAGGVFVVAVLVSVVLFPPGPDSLDQPAQILGYYKSHHAFDVISDLWSMGAASLLLALLTAMAANRAHAGARARAALILAAGAAACLFELMASAVEVALSTTVYRHGDSAVVAASYAIASKFFCTSLVMLAVAVTASAATQVSLRRATEAVCAAALGVAGIGGLLDPHTFGPAILLAEVALIVWVATNAIVLRPRRLMDGVRGRAAMSQRPQQDRVSG